MNRLSLRSTFVSGVMAPAAVGFLAAPAEARDHRGRNAGAAVAAGVIGGLAVGALAAQQPRYAAPQVRERRVIVEEDADEECEVRVRRMYVNGVMQTRRTTVCE